MAIYDSMLCRLFNNALGQTLLEYVVRKSQKFMGVGGGDNVRTSGEITLIWKLNDEMASQQRCIFDVGASRGAFIELITDNMMDDNFSIHCFEPSKKAFAELRSKYGDDERLVLNNLALGKEKGEFPLYYNEAGSEIASLTRRKLDHFGIDFSRMEMVSVTTLDDYCHVNRINRIHLLKLDVEGHELDVLLSGSEQMFQKRAVDMVSFEFGGCDIDTRTFLRDFFYFFAEQDMVIHRITPCGYLVPLGEYRESYEQFRTTNFLAFRLD